MMRRGSAILLFALAWVHAVSAHESRPAYLELRETEPATFDVLWKVPARGGAMRLGIDVLFPPDAEILGEPRSFFAGDAHVRRWRVRHLHSFEGHPISIEGLPATRTDALVRIIRLNGVTQTTRATPDAPAFVIEASPKGWQTAATYFPLGVEHILLGVDHLLFVLGLLLLVEGRLMLLKTITSFTVAHSITLALSTFAIVRIPEPPLNAAIALSILFLGPEIIRKQRGQSSLTIRRPWMVAFLFGLLHGIGFSSGLAVTGLPRTEIPSALLFFNLGVEAGQLAFVGVALLAVQAIRTLELDRPKWTTRIPAYLIGSLGAFWTIQRIALLAAGL